MLADILKESFSAEIVSTSQYLGQEAIFIQKKRSHEIFQFLKTDPRLSFEMLVDICGVDYLKLEENPRFEVVYHLYSLTHNHRLRIRLKVPEEDMKVASITDIWASANWPERETAEMFGIIFEKHPNPKNLLLFEGFQGHPLRKDYPMEKRQQIPVPLENL